MQFLACFAPNLVPYTLASSRTHSVHRRQRGQRLLWTLLLSSTVLGTGLRLAASPIQQPQTPAAAPPSSPREGSPSQAPAPQVAEPQVAEPQAAAPQAPAPQAPAPSAAPTTSSAPTSAIVPPATVIDATRLSEVTEQELQQQLAGKPLFLRGAYLGDAITFTERGDPVGNPLKGSFTLSGVQIDKVILKKHKVEFEGARYALHYVGGSPYDDPSKEADRVRITPRKKMLKITIDREQLTRSSKVKEKKGKQSKAKATAQSDSSAKAAAGAAGQAEAATELDSEKAEAATEQAADPKSVTTTSSPAHAGQVLREAINRVFALNVDQRMRAQLPDFWRLYFAAQAAGVEYRPKDPSVLRASAVDQQAKVLSSIAPASNPLAQANGIAGRALYRAVIGSDGKPSEIAVLRPIGFGLDENAIEAIRKASFQPAMKAGKPVDEALDLAVVFRIYSNQTGRSGNPAAANSATNSTTSPDTANPATGTQSQPAPVKPGPYSVKPSPPPQ